MKRIKLILAALITLALLSVPLLSRCGGGDSYTKCSSRCVEKALLCSAQCLATSDNTGQTDNTQKGMFASNSLCYAQCAQAAFVCQRQCVKVAEEERHSRD